MERLRYLQSHFCFSEVKNAQNASPEAQPTTIFDMIMSKKIPATIVYEDDQALAFRDIQPQAPTHILIIPKRRINMLQDMKADDK